MIYQNIKSNDNKELLYLFLIPCGVGFSAFYRDNLSIGWGISTRESGAYYDIPVFQENE